MPDQFIQLKDGRVMAPGKNHQHEVYEGDIITWRVKNHDQAGTQLVSLVGLDRKVDPVPPARDLSVRVSPGPPGPIKGKVVGSGYDSVKYDIYVNGDKVMDPYLIIRPRKRWKMHLLRLVALLGLGALITYAALHEDFSEPLAERDPDAAGGPGQLPEI